MSLCIVCSKELKEEDASPEVKIAHKNCWIIEKSFDDVRARINKYVYAQLMTEKESVLKRMNGV